MRNPCKINKRLGEIELLRFVFAFIVLVHHSRFLVGDSVAYFLKGSFAVEFFFLVSGYLLMKSIDKMTGQKGNLAEDTFTFISKKYLSVFPAVLISWIIGVVATSVIKDVSIPFLAAEGVWELFLVQMCGLGMNTEINSATWYLSSMLLCMAILYPLLRRYKTAALKIIVPIVSLLLLGWMFKTFGSPRNPTAWTGFTYRGNIRAFAEIGLGTTCYWITKNLSAVNFNRTASVFLTILKWFCYVAVILHMYVPFPVTYDFLFIAVLMVAISLSFSQKGIDAKWYNNTVVYFLGDLSLYMFLCHYYWNFLLGELLPNDLSVEQKTLIYIAVSFITALVVMTVCKLWERNKKAIFSLCKKCFLTKD